MRILFKLASYIFHPIWMPFAGALFFFLVSPRFFPLEIIKAKLLAIAIMTLFIPIVFYFMMRSLGMASSYFLEDVKERKWPLLFHIFILLIILEYVLSAFDYPALYYYFTGIIISTILALGMVLLNLKISLHLMALGGITCFILILSFYFGINLVYTISFMIAITGLTASSRLYFKAHTYKELFLGYSAGFIPQVFVLYLWL